MLTVRAEDPRTGEVDTFEIPYDVVPPIVPDEDEKTPWGWIWAIIIIAVLAYAIAFGAVMMYRKHYGEVVECGECGAFIAASSTTCPKCGIEFETDLARCSECEAWIPANSSACPVCGTAFTIESLEEQVAREEAAEARKAKIEALSNGVTITQKAGEEGRLFGSVGTSDIADACAAVGVEMPLYAGGRLSAREKAAAAEARADADVVADPNTLAQDCASPDEGAPADGDVGKDPRPRTDHGASPDDAVGAEPAISAKLGHRIHDRGRMNARREIEGRLEAKDPAALTQSFGGVRRPAVLEHELFPVTGASRRADEAFPTVVGNAA